MEKMSGGENVLDPLWSGEAQIEMNYFPGDFLVLTQTKQSSGYI